MRLAILIALVLSGCASRSFQESFLSANNAFARGQYQEAVELLDDAAEERQVFSVYHLRGLSHAALGEFEESIKDYNTAIKLNPKHQPTYTERALAKLALENYTGALRDLDYAVELRPTDEIAFYNRANVLVRLGDFNAANSDYSEALKLNNQFGQAYYNRYLVRKKLGQTALSEQDREAASSLGISEELIEDE